jgi:hypothetical protein
MGKRDPAMSVLVALTGFARARSWRCGLTTSRDAPGSSDLETEGEVTAAAPVDAKIGAFPTADILSWETGQRNDQGRPPHSLGNCLMQHPTLIAALSLRPPALRR